MFDSKPSSEEPTLYSFDTTITFSFDYKEDKQIILDNKNECMLSIMKAVGVKSLENSNISNRGFTFKRNARLNNEFKRKQKAKQYGIPLNSPILNWEEGTFNNGSKFWHNRITDQYVFNDPFVNFQSKSLKEVAPINSPVANWQEILSNNGRKQWYSPATGKLTYNDPYEVKGGFVRKTLKIKSYRDKSNTRSRRSL
jgi:hypothetical protein